MRNLIPPVESPEAIKRGLCAFSNNELRVTSVRARSAFTLIEVLLYMGLVALFMTAMVCFAWDVVLGNVKAGVHQEVQENLRFASHKIQVEIRNADNITSIGESELSLSGTAPDYPVEFRVDQGTLQIKRGAGSWISLTSSLVEVTELVFTNLSGFEVLGCGSFEGTDMACCFYQDEWVCERVEHHGLNLETDCLGELGGGSVEHKQPCKGAVTYENVHFTLTVQHRNPSGKSEWEKEATFETSVQLR